MQGSALPYIQLLVSLAPLYLALAQRGTSLKTTWEGAQDKESSTWPCQVCHVHVKCGKLELFLAAWCEDMMGYHACCDFTNLQWVAPRAHNFNFACVRCPDNHIQLQVTQRDALLCTAACKT